jgi:hypothetical protein
MPSAGGRTSLDAIRAGREALSREHVVTPRQRGQREALRVLQVFIDAARPFADEPVPPADYPRRHAWIQGIKAVLDKAADILVNLAVAAAFTVNAVEVAAQHAVTETVEVAARVLDHAAQAWPSLVWVSAHQTVSSGRACRGCQQSRG